MKKTILYAYPINSSFVRGDREILRQRYNLIEFGLVLKNNYQLPFLLIKQFFFLLFNTHKAALVVVWFGSYHSLLPLFFAKVFGRPSLLILGGTDCVSFPSINYGNFNKPLLAWFTRESLKLATHLSPVDDSLAMSDYKYQDKDYTKQGFRFFCPSVITPYTTLHLGYNPEKFFRTREKTPNSFLTVAQMNLPNFYRKGVDLIFKMAERFPDCTFTIIGNTNEMTYPTIPPNLHLMPFVPYEQLRDHYSSHEFYFQISICEGFPSAICEAMLCECIPIGSEVAAIPEIIGDAGFILKHKDEKELEELMRAALQSNKKELGEKARRRIMDKYPANEREKLLGLTEDIIAFRR